ncbi:hypothetical protein [uncultured Algibacter sp.]|uniref:hypothetical protein n=1 Tax=uncultured Algibacter sp. TaxID=298659 RepID=UPI00260B1CA1|nr:hypothetical protein [uncultured Algibacter sp.]
MKKKLLLLITTLITINSYSQITFEKGYFIYDSGLKVECLIKNIDWSNNPSEFEYKLSEDSDQKKVTIKTIKEFGIYNASRYQKSKVKIDRSSEKIGDLTYNRKPILKEEVLFLKVLIEGKANLYAYKDGNLNRFFYNIEASNIEQLIFKKYKNNENDIKKNSRYKQQLWTDLQCTNLKMSDIESLKYKQNSLIDFFSKYNECENATFKSYEKNKEKDLFNLTLRPRLNSSSLSITKN